ncbi:MAG: Ig-like domain-containing protein, partial [Thermodesulfobacteriota bacterium]
MKNCLRKSAHLSRRTHAPPGRFLAALILSAVLCLAAALPAGAQTSEGFPEKVFAPYVDVTNWPTFSISDTYQQTGQKYYTLAFITAGADHAPSWGGVVGMDQDWYRDEIEYIRSQGGDVIVSFGGANGTELALAHTNIAELTAAYQSVIDRYGLTWVDFDIEGFAVGDKTSVDRRNKAVKALQDANPELRVAFCLPVLPQGLTADGVYVLTNAKQNGVRIDVVNVMAMDYGDWAAPNPDGHMGQYAVDAAQSTRAQLQQVGINAAVGVTPMIGQNDTPTEVFGLADAEVLVAWANEPAQADWFGLLAFWSANRDNNGCPGGSAQPGCSGVLQDDFAFTEIFGGFGQGSGGNARPVVSITSPADQASFAQGADIAITADASDPDGTIAQVEFYRGATLLGTDTAAPYQAVMANAAAGVYDLTAVARDNEGATRTSIAVRIYVGNVCSAPAWKASSVYTANDKVSYGGHTWKAKWWTQGETPGTTGPWGVWQDLGACGNNQPPQVALTSPADQEIFPEGADILIAASASDPDGSIARVDFYQGATLLGTDTSSPYQAVLSGAQAGAYQLTAKATDNNGAETTSAAVRITVGNQAPQVAVTSPADQATFNAGANITVAATASDPDGSIVMVAFYRDAVLLGTDTTPPYQAVFANAPEGSYALSARATDNNGAVSVSTPVHVTVQRGGDACGAPAWSASAVYKSGAKVSHAGHLWMAKWWTQGDTPGTTGQWGVWKDLGPCSPNEPPQVVIIGPEDQAAFDAGTDIVISADAEDPDGSIARVEFYDGGTPLGSDTQAPYSLTLFGAQEGTHVLTAKAYDNQGASAQSPAVTIVVGTPGGGGQDECDAPAWDAGQNWTTYKVGDLRTDGGRLWECINIAYAYWAPSG